MQREPADLHQQSVGHQPPAASLAAISLSAAYACLHSLTIFPPPLFPLIITKEKMGGGAKPLKQGPFPFPQTHITNLGDDSSSLP